MDCDREMGRDAGTDGALEFPSEMEPTAYCDPMGLRDAWASRKARLSWDIERFAPGELLRRFLPPTEGDGGTDIV